MRPEIIPTPVQEIHEEIFQDHGTRVFIKRDDLIHPNVSGNKWRKLKYNLKHAQESGVKHIISFGGAYSNHIHALSFSCMCLGLPLTIFVRGEETQPLNPTLNDLHLWGTEIRYLSREQYRDRNKHDFLDSIKSSFPHSMIIPEGGTNDLALRGLEEMMEELDRDYDEIMVPVGTGGTLSGCLRGATKGSSLTGFVVLKGLEQIKTDIAKLAGHSDFELCHDYHFGGYAKFTRQLIAFMNSFRQNHGIPLDPIYTGKMMFGFFDQVRKGLHSNKRVLLIHTGGIQGVRGFNERFGDLLN